VWAAEEELYALEEYLLEANGGPRE
jgi:hypothetical protein